MFYQNIFQNVRRLFIGGLQEVCVDIQGGACLRMTQAGRHGTDVLIVRNQQCGGGMPLRYNNDKQKKPLFSRGLSVCRLLFNSFSKLKIDENYKEKGGCFINDKI